MDFLKENWFPLLIVIVGALFLTGVIRAGSAGERASGHYLVF